MNYPKFKILEKVWYNGQTYEVRKTLRIHYKEDYKFEYILVDGVNPCIKVEESLITPLKKESLRDNFDSRVSSSMGYMPLGRGRSYLRNQLPNRVIFNDKKKATTLIDDNDNVTVVKTMKGDKYNKEFGFLMAYFQHYSGLSKTQAKKYIKGVINED